MEATSFQALGPNRRGAGLDFPLHSGTRGTGELGVHSSPLFPPSKPGAGEDTRGAQRPREGSREPRLLPSSPGVRRLAGSRAPPCHAPTSPLPFSFLSYTLPLGRKRAIHKRISTPVHCPREALGIHLAFSHIRKGRQAPAPPCGVRKSVTRPRSCSKIKSETQFCSL